MVKATKAHSASRRQFLVAAPAAAALASVPASASVPSDVSSDLLVLLKRYADLKMEAARLNAAYKVCTERYKAMRPALPDELPTFEHKRGTVDWDLYSRVRTDDGPTNRLMHTEAYWRRCGDLERAEIAKAYFAADDRAQEESGVGAAGQACDDQMDQVIAADADVVEFPCRTLGDAISLARFAWDQSTAGEQLLDDFVNYLIAAILRLDKQTDQAALDEWLADLADERREV
jgi:hypothetical protein